MKAQNEHPKAVVSGPERESFDAYLTEIAQVPLLQRNSEKDLARTVWRLEIKWRRSLLDNPAMSRLLLQRWEQLHGSRRLSSSLSQGSVETGASSRAPLIDEQLGRVAAWMRERDERLKARRGAPVKDLETAVRRTLARLQLSNRVLESIQTEIASDPAAAAKLGRVPRRRMDVMVARTQRHFEELLAQRAILVTSNLRLVVHIARPFQRLGLSMPDLVQEGNIGLMRAVEMFDYRRGVKFSTYSGHWIRQSIQRALQTKARTIRLPTGVEDRLRAIQRSAEGDALRGGGEAGADRRATLLDEDEECLLLGTTLREPRSIDAPVSEDGSQSLGELLVDPDQVPIWELLDEQRTGQMLERLVQRLEPRNRRVIRARFGLNGETPATLESIGKDLGLSRERVRQIEKAALEELRDLASSRGLDRQLH